MNAEPGVGPPGRALGLDVGDRRIGVAISDPDGRIAVPVRTIERDGRGGEVTALERLAREEEVRALVVGLPLSMSGERGAQAERSEEFGRMLGERLGMTVVLWDERLSTQEAERLSQAAGMSERRRRGRPGSVGSDALAAAIILQAYLDSRRPREPLGT